LVHNAVPFGQAQERGELFFRSVGVKRELQPYVLEPDWNLLGQTKRSPEVEITFGLERGISQFDAKRRSYCVECHASAGHESFEQHVA